MGFKDWFVDENTGNTSVKVQCTGCQRITVEKFHQTKLLRNGMKKQSAVSVMPKNVGYK